MINEFNQFGSSVFGDLAWPVLWNLIKIVALVLPLMGCVAYLTLWERKGIGWTQVRPGPNRVGPYGLLTPIADAVKLIFKEIIRPTRRAAAKTYTDIRRWTEMPRGGHFAAMEQPAALSEEVRAFFRDLR